MTISKFINKISMNKKWIKSAFSKMCWREDTKKDYLILKAMAFWAIACAISITADVEEYNTLPSTSKQ